MEPTVELLLNKIPPSHLEKNIHRLRTYYPDYHDGNKNRQLLQCHFVPFQVIDKTTQDGERPFLICAHNCDVASGMYRSPWTNHLHQLHQEQENVDIKTGGLLANDAANEEIRGFELKFNQVWDAYKNLYYGHEAVGSIYLNNVVDSDTASCLEGYFCIQKLCSNADSSWNSISFVRAKVINEFECEYSIDTTVCVIINPSSGSSKNEHVDTGSTQSSSKIEIGTTMSKNCIKTCKIQPDKVPIHTSHIEHIGTIIEANEIELRSNLERVVIPKHQEIISTIQKKQTQRRPQVNPLMGMMMNSDMLKKRLAKSSSDS